MSNLINPPRKFTVMPFWFWNDVLNETEIIRQINDFEKHGVYGFVIHPRVGLPHDLSWMSEKLLYYYKIALDEAKQRKMFVSLYDEGMYPSGSSSGQVVAENPTYACRCLAKIDLPNNQAPNLKDNENLVALLQRQNGEFIAVIDRPVISHIRGLHYIGEGPQEEHPPAADLLNPHAVATFIRLVYDKFAEHFSEYFGKTIVSIFTDEPNLLGKCKEREVFPGTTDILRHVNKILGYDFTPHLAALWYDDEPNALQFRQDYLSALKIRLQQTYYQPLYKWCKQHHIALTGHPQQPDDIGILRFFHIPGQDLVWRKILPDHFSALEGAESTQAKCSSSVMLHRGLRRNSNECFGAYGHQFSWKEMLWLTHWLFVRGVNLLYPHAFYYSVRGVRRDERPPDVGPHSPWWENYQEYALACRRFAWINSDSLHICSIAILGKADYLPWQAAKICFQNQRDFNYLTERDILELAVIDASGIHIAGLSYQVLILEYEPSSAVMTKLSPLLSSGQIIFYRPQMSAADLTEKLDHLVPCDIKLFPATKAVRIRHVVKENCHYYILFNEEKSAVKIEINTATKGEFFLFNPYSGITLPLPEKPSLQLAGHEAVILNVKEKVPLVTAFARSVDWLLPLTVPENEALLIFSVCDSKYLDYAISLVRSADVFSPGFQFLLHVVNPSEDDKQRLQQLLSVLTATRLSVSYEDTELSDFSLEQQRTYYACVRFLRLAELLPTLNVPVLCLDADSLIVNPIDLGFSNKLSAQLCLLRRDVQGNLAESLAVANGSIWLAPTEGVQNLINQVVADINTAFINGSAAWYLDQIVMGRQINSGKHKIGIFNIKKKYADWDFRDSSIVWISKKAENYMDMFFYLLQKINKEKAFLQITAKISGAAKSLPSKAQLSKINEARKPCVQGTVRKFNSTLSFLYQTPYEDLFAERVPLLQAFQIALANCFRNCYLNQSTLMKCGEMPAFRAVECGVYTGSSLIACAQMAKDSGLLFRIYGLDTFKGLPPISKKDDEWAPLNAKYRYSTLFADTSIEIVKEKIIAAGITSGVELYQGLFSYSLPLLPEQTYHFINIDCDLYEPHLECLEYFYSRMERGGIIFFDDYHSIGFPMAAKAIDLFMQDKPEKLMHLRFGDDAPNHTKAFFVKY